ncbi:MAG TPA: hypothetical protein V6D33_12200 [Cyanophyceae cyanobacterium]
MNIQLNSDFRDYYDHWFASPSVSSQITFNRYSRTEMTKLEQFNLLIKAGLNTPIFGRVGDSHFFRIQQWLKAKVVLYVDDLAHRGEGKKLEKFSMAQAYKDCPFSVFVPTTGEPEKHSISHRYLQIGDRAWWLKYEGKGSWLSNHAQEIEIELIGESCSLWEHKKRTKLFGQYPLFAIDFVTPIDSPETRLAVDFNSAPGIGGTGIEEILSAKECYREIALWLNR